MAETQTAVAIDEPGWFDLSTPDPEGARSFYAKLFGWSAEVAPDPQAGGYGFFKQDGKEVGGVGQLQNQQQPPAWTTYILVDDAKATTEKAKENGAAVFMEPFDVMGQGTMAVLADPTGAVFGLWQPGLHRGVELKDATGAVCWSEVMTRGFDRAKQFYATVFGWEPTVYGGGEGEQGQGIPYHIFNHNGRGIVGGMELPSEAGDVPPHWQLYFAVTSADETAKRAGELGGGVMMGPSDIPDVGRYAILRDPQGAFFGILQPQPRRES